MSSYLFRRLDITIVNNELYRYIYKYAKMGAFSELNIDGSDLSDYYWDSGRYEYYEDHYNNDKIHNEYEVDAEIMSQIYDSDDELTLCFSAVDNSDYVIPKTIYDVIPCLLIYMSQEFYWNHELFLRFKNELLEQSHDMTEHFQKVVWKESDPVEWPVGIVCIDRSFVYDGNKDRSEYSEVVQHFGKAFNEDTLFSDYNWDELDHRGDNPDRKEYSWYRGPLSTDPYRKIADAQRRII